MSATTDIIIEYQSASPEKRASIEARYPNFLRPSKQTCKRCHGAGFIVGSRLPHCPKCGGDGCE